jgi:hypothetical protein
LVTLAALASRTHGAFRGRDAVREGVSRKQLVAFVRSGAIERVLPDTYRLAGAPARHDHLLAAALLWGGSSAAATGPSAGHVYELEGIEPTTPEIFVPRSRRLRASSVVVHQWSNPVAAMVRSYRGFRVTGIEATLVTLAASVDAEALEVACEDARRRRLTSVPALRAYLERFGEHGRAGCVPLRRLVDELDPQHPSRSTLEVKTRRLLVAHGIKGFVREFPLEWRDRRYLFDFAFPAGRTILETNSRRWHDDPADDEYDHEKWSVPARFGYRVVFATWSKVTRRPRDLLDELGRALAAV